MQNCLFGGSFQKGKVKGEAEKIKQKSNQAEQEMQMKWMI